MDIKFFKKTTKEKIKDVDEFKAEEMKNIDNLRSAIKTKIKVIYKPESEFLNQNTPACIKDSTIFILNSLSTLDKIICEAHELGHQLLLERGLILLRADKYSPEYYDYFALHLNNLISHKELIKTLKEEFNISSDLHLKIRYRELAAVKEDITEFENNQIVLQATGLSLLDTYLTIDEPLKGEVLKILELNQTVKTTFEIAQLHVNNISSKLSKSEQISIIKKLLNDLKLNSYYFNIKSN